MEQLSKDQLDQMPLEDQIKYINNELKKEKASLTGVCKAIGIGRTTVRERAKKLGFIFDKGLNKYVKNINKPDTIQTATPTATKNQDTKIQEVTKENNSGVSVDNSDVVSFNNGVVEVENYFKYEHTLDYIDSNIDLIKEFFEKIKENKKNIPEGSKDIVIDLIDDRHLDPKPRSFRVNSFVLNDWDQFCNENRYYQKMDLVSMALKEYIENHRK